jgi:hypothetical protein
LTYIILLEVFLPEDFLLLDFLLEVAMFISCYDLLDVLLLDFLRPAAALA